MSFARPAECYSQSGTESMKARSRSLLASFVVHLFVLVTFSLFGDVGTTTSGNRFGDGSTGSRSRSMRGEVTQDRLARLEESLSKEVSTKTDPVIEEDLDEIDALDQALTSGLSYQDSLSNKVSDGSPQSFDRELTAAIKLDEDWSDDGGTAGNRSNDEDIGLIDHFTTEAQSPFPSLLSNAQMRAQGRFDESRGSVADSNTSGGGVLELIDTLSYDESIGSRFLSDERSFGVWSHVDSWYVLGPLKADHTFLADRDPSGRIEIDLGENLSTKRGVFLGWEYERLQMPSIALEDGELNRVRYMYTELHSEIEQKVIIWIRSSADVALWVNESEEPSIVIDQDDNYSPVDYDLIDLKRGYNSLLVRVDSRGKHGYLWLAHSTVVVSALVE